MLRINRFYARQLTQRFGVIDALDQQPVKNNTELLLDSGSWKAALQCRHHLLLRLLQLAVVLRGSQRMQL